MFHSHITSVAEKFATPGFSKLGVGNQGQITGNEATELFAPGFQPPVLQNPGQITGIEGRELFTPGLTFEVVSPTGGSGVGANNPCPFFILHVLCSTQYNG